MPVLRTTDLANSADLAAGKQTFSQTCLKMFSNYLNVISKLSQHDLNIISAVSKNHFKTVSKSFQHYRKFISTMREARLKMISKLSQNVFKLFQSYFKTVSAWPQHYFGGISKSFQNCLKIVSTLSQIHLNNAWSTSQNDLKIVSKCFQNYLKVIFKKVAIGPQASQRHVTKIGKGSLIPKRLFRRDSIPFKGCEREGFPVSSFLKGFLFCWKAFQRGSYHFQRLSILFKSFSHCILPF